MENDEEPRKNTEDQAAREVQKIDDIIAELVRVTEGLIFGRVSFPTITDYLVERVGSLDEDTARRCLILAIVSVIEERHKGELNPGA